MVVLLPLLIQEGWITLISHYPTSHPGYIFTYAIPVMGILSLASLWYNKLIPIFLKDIIILLFKNTTMKIITITIAMFLLIHLIGYGQIEQKVSFNDTICFEKTKLLGNTFTTINPLSFL